MEKCQAIDSGRAVERRAGAALRRDDRGDCRRDAGRVLTGPGLPAARALGAADRLAERRGGGAVPHRSDAWKCDRAARNRSDGQGEARRVRRRTGRADGAQVARRAIRADVAVRSETAADAHQYEGMLFDLGRADRLLRRSGRRALAHVHAEGRRPAVRAEARARVSLSCVHRPRAAQGRGRRRHRRAEGHRSPRPRRADDDVAGRRRSCCTTRTPRGCAGAGGDGGLDGKFVADTRRLLSHRARRANRREGDGVAAVHDRRAGRSAADRLDLEAGARHVGVADRGGVRRGARRRRLRRQGSRAGVLGQRRRREDAAAVRRQEPADAR